MHNSLIVRILALLLMSSLLLFKNIDMDIRNTFSILVVIILFSFSGYAQPWIVNSDQWTATDALRRTLPAVSEIGIVNGKKIVGMFYWTLHQANGPGGLEPHNLTQFLAQYDAATKQAMMNNYNHANWQNINQFHWDEPLFGFYRSTDSWVLRKHAEMLADAGVDVVFFDCTNEDYTWKDSYTKLIEVWEQARRDGVKTPQIAFTLPFAANQITMNSLTELYKDLYQPGLHNDLLFKWDGKPIIMAYPESLVAGIELNASMKFTANAPFYGINATCPSWSNNTGNLTFKLYRWNNNYNQTVNGAVLAEQTFVDFNDGSKLQLSFNALGAGDYLWDLSAGTEKVGVWKWTDSTGPATSYFSGTQVAGNYKSEIAYDAALNFTALTSGAIDLPVAIGSSIDQAMVNEIKAYFTFRPGQPDYVQGPTQTDHWSWLEVFPQHGYPLNPINGFEQVSVSIGQNASQQSNRKCASFNGPNTFGRNYSSNANGMGGFWDTSEDGYLKGANFQQQWNRAFELNPKMAFVTGWNEWVVGRHDNWVGCTSVAQVASSFPDAFDKFRSRDIEPVKSWGNKGDVYYLQLISNVRKFKGMQAQKTASATKIIDMANIGSWSDVTPEYNSYKGNTLHRNHPGYGNNLTYTNTTGRNDLTTAKVARDGNYVYFYVKTENPLTNKSNPKWMRLFVDIDRDKSTGWEGYDFIINRSSPTSTALVEKSTNSWAWQTAGNAEITINEKSLVLKVPYTALGLSINDPLNFEFKWSDNMQEDGNIMDFYVNGDVAPGARFNYVYNDAVAIVSSLDLGFEEPQIPTSPGHTYSPSGGYWIHIGASGIVSNDGGFGNPTSPQGIQACLLQQTGSVQQSMNFATSGAFKVKFKAAQRTGSNQTFKVYADAILVGTINPSSTSYLPYTTNSFALSAGNHIIKFVGTNPLGGDNTAFIDDISIVAGYDLGFEEPKVSSLPGYNYNPSGGFWTFIGSSGIVTDGGGFGNPTSPQGTQACLLQQLGSIEQIINFATAGSYKVDLKAAQRSGNNQTFKVYFDNTLIATINPSSAGYLKYTSNIFSVTAGNHTIKLVGTNPLGGDNSVFIDDIGIVAVTTDLGFETPVISSSPGYVYGPTGGSFTYTGTSGIVKNGGSFGNTNAPEGNQACFLQESGYVKKMVNFPISSTYKINFKAAQRIGSTQTLKVYIDGNLIGTITPSSNSYLSYSTNSYFVNAGSHTVKFTGTNPLGGDNTIYIDDLQIQATANNYGKKGSTGELLDIIDVEDLKKLQLNSYPNPCSEYTDVRFNLENTSMVNFEVYNLAGVKVISTSKQYNSGDNLITLYVDNLAAGIYIVKVTTDSFFETLKIIVQ